jgi:hypothetical protein
MDGKQSLSARYLVLLAFGICLFSGPISAQTVAKGEFDLTCATQWGLATLPAGHYTFMLDSTAKQGTLTVRGAKPASMIHATVIDDHSAVDRNELILVRNGSLAVVRAMRLAEYGITFYYQIPRSATIVADNKPELIQRAPIVVNGK